MDEEAAQPQQVSLGDGSTDVLQSVKDMITAHLAFIDKQEADLKDLKDELDAILLQSDTYQELSKKALEASKVKQETKKQILRHPQTAQIVDKMKQMSSELKEHKNSLSDYLTEYQRLSGENEIIDSQGTVRRIISVARLARKTA